MSTAQELFTTMLREEVGPGLRELGLRGSGRNYKLADPDAFRLLSFQGWHYSTAVKLQFTVNLAVISQHEYETRSKHEFETKGWRWGKAPTATAQYPVGEYIRLGQLMPDSGDRWWELRVGDEPSLLAVELIEAIAKYGLPWLRRLPVRRTG